MNATSSTASIVIAIHDFQLAAIIIFLVSSMGTICNLLVAFFTSRLPSLSNPFGRLSASQSTGEMILCITFALYYSPMVFFDISSMKRNAHHIGLLLLICYNICIVSHLVIAVNRMCAICFPLSYEKAFSQRNTSIMIAVIWTVSLALPICLHGMEDCSLIYSDVAWVFIFKPTERCGFISWYIDFGQDFATVLLIAVIDLITIVKVRLTSAQFAVATLSSCTRRARDIRFLKQAIAQGTVFAIELFTYFFLSWMFKDKWMIFLFTTFAWNLVHLSDPIIIITCNREFRRFVCAPLEKNFRRTAINPRSSTTMARTTQSIKLGPIRGRV